MISFRRETKSYQGQLDCPYLIPLLQKILLNIIFPIISRRNQYYHASNHGRLSEIVLAGYQTDVLRRI